MATPVQSKYIADLAVKKLKEFKEVKELLLSTEIVSDNAETVKDAKSIAEITNALDDLQASKFIDVLVAHKEPARDTSYSQKRTQKTIDLLDEVKADISNWSFE